MVSAAPETTTFDPAARLERACELIVDAGAAGAEWIVFPEAYLPGCPAWLWECPLGAELACELRALTDGYALTIPGELSDRLCRVAQRSRVAVAIGILEREHATWYNAMLLIDRSGHICGHYRDPQQRSWLSVGTTVVHSSGSGDEAYDVTHVGGI